MSKIKKEATEQSGDYLTTVLHSTLIDCVYKAQDKLAGKILTVIDATIQDSTQREATKSLIKQMVYTHNIQTTIKEILTAAHLRLKKEGSGSMTEHKDPYWLSDSMPLDLPERFEKVSVIL